MNSTLPATKFYFPNPLSHYEQRFVFPSGVFTYVLSRSFSLVVSIMIIKLTYILVLSSRILLVGVNVGAVNEKAAFVDFSQALSHLIYLYRKSSNYKLHEFTVNKKVINFMSVSKKVCTLKKNNRSLSMFMCQRYIFPIILGRSMIDITK